MSDSFLTDRQWQVIYAFLQTQPHLYVRQEAKVRQFVEAVLWLLDSGAKLRRLPKDQGKWNSVYKRFARWEQAGVWQALFQHVATAPDWEWLVLDSTTIRAHPSAAGASKKKAGKRRKPSAAVPVVSAPKSMP